jgi:hypothetical protein
MSITQDWIFAIKVKIKRHRKWTTNLVKGHQGSKKAAIN